jgi:quercetin dioxygenase-like cupin family protein
MPEISGAPHPTTTTVDLTRLDGSGGVVWSVSPAGFHANLVVLDAGAAIAAHRNDDVDVLLVVVHGGGTAHVDEQPVELTAGTATLIARGATRSVVAGQSGIRYLTVHAERTPLTIGRAGPPLRRPEPIAQPPKEHLQ